METENDCVFCKIVRGEIPSHTVYEDDLFIAFLDIHPLSPGHLLIVPKKHYRWVWDIPEGDAYFELAQKLAHVLQKTFGTDEIHAKVVGEEVPHAHFWLFPAPNKASGNPTDFGTNTSKIRQALG